MSICLCSINIILTICLIGTVSQLLEDIGYVVIISPPLFGHLIPLLDLADNLSEYYHVTFVLSASKLDELKRRELLRENLSLEFIELFDNNEEDYQVVGSTTTVPVDSIVDRMNKPLKELFFASSSSSSRSIRHPVDLIIYDSSVYIVAEIAHEQHIPVHAFIPNNLMFIPRFINISMDKSEVITISRKFAQKVIGAYSFIDGILCNSFYEFDKTILNELYERSLLKANLPVRFIAPLISLTNEHEHVSSNNKSLERIQIWLNIQQNTSNTFPFIIYVAFGSFASFQPEQLVEIAHALQNYSVIWSLKTNLQTFLPSTFVENPNHLLLNWSPQRYILSQSSVRLFLSHGGWNSLLETMLAGKITLVWPMISDQFMNGYRLENELRIGRSMKNLTEIYQQRIFHQKDIENYLQDIFDHEKIYFHNMQQIQQMIRNAQHTDAQQSFQDILRIIDIQRRKRLNLHEEF